MAQPWDRLVSLDRRFARVSPAGGPDGAISRGGRSICLDRIPIGAYIQSMKSTKTSQAERVNRARMLREAHEAKKAIVSVKRFSKRFGPDAYYTKRQASWAYRATVNAAHHAHLTETAS